MAFYRFDHLRPLYVRHVAKSMDDVAKSMDHTAWNLRRRCTGQEVGHVSLPCKQHDTHIGGASYGCLFPLQSCHFILDVQVSNKEHSFFNSMSHVSGFRYSVRLL